MLDRRHRGGSLLGKLVRPGRTIVCSEEHDLIWASSQNNPIRLRRWFNELRVVADYPAGVLILHQTCTARGRAGAHGFAGAFADILIDMSCPSADRTSRRRHFSGVGRYPGMLQHAAAELNSAGTDYLLVADSPPGQMLNSALETLKRLLSQNSVPLARQEILNNWPEPGTPLLPIVWAGVSCALANLALSLGAGPAPKRMHSGMGWRHEARRWRWSAGTRLIQAGSSRWVIGNAQNGPAFAVDQNGQRVADHAIALFRAIA